MKIVLVAIDPAVYVAFDRIFAGAKHVQVIYGDILNHRAEAIVSPANSFGWMDGGIDLAHVRVFGKGVETRLQRLIRERWEGELPIGRAQLVPTGFEPIPWMISAPTMRVPEPVGGTRNAYLAFAAALMLAREEGFSSLLSPGLCTLTGRMHPLAAASQMRQAYDAVIGATHA
ncbi:O-acetyl-ADP-ribose deacetylase (regulator of RNase III) [Paraburkholderia sp. BL8N3]|nr:macro domain-containing protein [Paraburkholderia sp. BL8N3]TCK36742.1 O-acetyl-ADP-ribose deacetylase (regulator of RNase III) [Paraburkholderia sp. BL8N3]